MSSPVENALYEIMQVVSSVTGLAQAPTNPNETQNVFPFAIGYYMTGSVGAQPIGTRKRLFNVSVEVLTKRINLPSDLALLLPFVDTIPDKLIAEVSDAGDLFNTSITTFDNVLIEFIPDLEYAGVQMIGYRFVMENIKILI